MIRCLLLGMLLCPVSGEDGGITGEQVLRNVEAAFSGVDDFTVSVDIAVDMEGLRVPPMHVMMYYKKPDMVHLEAEGFAMLPREGMGLNFIRLLRQFSAGSPDLDTIAGKTDYMLRLKPRDERDRRRSLLLYVDRERWTPDLLMFTSLDGRVTTARILYEQKNGFLLPAVVTVKLSTAEADSADISPAGPETAIPRRQFLRKGTITVRYSDYRVNTGIGDDIFEKETQRPHD